MKFNKYFCNEEIIYIMGTSMVLNTIRFFYAEPRLSALMLNPFKHMQLCLFEGSSGYYVTKKEQEHWYTVLDVTEHRSWVKLI